MRPDLRYAIISIVVSFSLGACGIKGPLYIPEKQYPQDTGKTESKVKNHSEKQPGDDVVPAP